MSSIVAAYDKTLFYNRPLAKIRVSDKIGV